MNDRRRVLQLTGVVLFTAVVLSVDVLTPTGIEVCVLYLPVILFLVMFNNARWIASGVAAWCWCSCWWLLATCLLQGTNPAYV